MRLAEAFTRSVTYISRVLLIGAVLTAPLTVAAQTKPLPSADEVMSQAKASAAAEHKNILLVFSASWCGPCHMFEAFLKDPQIHPIMDKAFVFATLDVGEHANDKHHADSPGGVALKAALGGADAGYPYILMLDAQGQPIANSLRPDPKSKSGDNIGYPATPAEIDWFMQMLAKSAPSLLPQEMAKVNSWLKIHSPV